MKPRAYVILNPVAGQSNPEQIRALLDEACNDNGTHYDLYETTGEDDLQEVVQEALQNDYDLVLACGGDGTISGVADGLAGSGISLGLIPIGTTNAFATELGIPNSPREALGLVFGTHSIRQVDALKHGGRYYILEASLGVFSSSFEDVERKKKDRLGWLAYVDTAIRNWIGLDPLHVRLVVDGVRYSFRASEVALFNTSQVGIIDEDLVTDTHINDGVLDLYALHSKSLLDILRIFLFRLVGKPKEAPHIRYWRVKEQVRIRTDPEVSFQADGDIQGRTPATFDVASGVLRVIVSEV